MENATTEKKGFLQNDRLLVCGMLVFYGICILGCIAAIYWGLNRMNQTISTKATSTASVSAIEQAMGTATALAHTADQDTYEFIERFDQVSGRWFVGVYGPSYENARSSIEGGVYIWDIRNSRNHFQAVDFFKGNKIKDFDVYVDLKFVESSQRGVACSGLFFRRPTTNWENGAYVFTICNNSHYKVNYYGNGAWQGVTYSEYLDIIQPEDWNRVEVSARGNRFTFTINNMVVFEMTDDRLERGMLGIFIEVTEENSALLWFDNFGYQSR